MTKGLLHNVTTIAFDELLEKHLKPSKFGYFITEEERENLLKALVDFMETSRNLKTRGDKILSTGASQGDQKPLPSNKKFY